MDYGQVKHERQRCYDICRRCHESEKPSAVARIGEYLENYTAWTMHRVSKILEYYVEWFDDPVIVFENLEGIREDIECDDPACGVGRDHADRNATVNTAVRGIGTLEDGDDSHDIADNYRPRKPPPQVRVRRVGSGRDISRPTPSLALAEQGVLA